MIPVFQGFLALLRKSFSKIARMTCTVRTLYSVMSYLQVYST